MGTTQTKINDKTKVVNREADVIGLIKVHHFPNGAHIELCIKILFS
jgi:hypothetical protein